MRNYTLKLRNPATAAPVIAELLGGEALPLPPLTNAWIVLTPVGDGLELYPDTLNRHRADANPFSDEARGPMLLMASSLPASRLATLASNAGWPSRHVCRHDEAIVEIAVEGRHVLAIVAESTSLMIGASQRLADEASVQPPRIDG